MKRRQLTKNLIKSFYRLTKWICIFNKQFQKRKKKNVRNKSIEVNCLEF